MTTPTSSDDQDYTLDGSLVPDTSREPAPQVGPLPVARRLTTKGRQALRLYERVYTARTPMRRRLLMLRLDFLLTCMTPQELAGYYDGLVRWRAEDHPIIRSTEAACITTTHGPTAMDHPSGLVSSSASAEARDSCPTSPLPSPESARTAPTGVGSGGHTAGRPASASGKS